MVILGLYENDVCPQILAILLENNDKPPDLGAPYFQTNPYENWTPVLRVLGLRLQSWEANDKPGFGVPRIFRTKKT